MLRRFIEWKPLWLGCLLNFAGATVGRSQAPEPTGDLIEKISTRILWPGRKLGDSASAHDADGPRPRLLDDSFGDHRFRRLELGPFFRHRGPRQAMEFALPVDQSLKYGYHEITITVLQTEVPNDSSPGRIAVAPAFLRSASVEFVLMRSVVPLLPGCHHG
jgi:hypothetical protein